ncbi:MAG TPA: hypothetical protein DCQ53_04970, partial [Alphaproteobacteria bacterium]|nr:hypothetical protein [Alphaproteobacteria bacterium]
AERVEHVNETAFNAARRSDENFQARIAEAEKLTARAAQAADEAADSVRRRMESVLEAAKSESTAIEREIQALGDRLGSLPETARMRARETVDILRQGLEGLNAAAMTAAEEAQEIDAAFQSRI